MTSTSRFGALAVLALVLGFGLSEYTPSPSSSPTFRGVVTVQAPVAPPLSREQQALVSYLAAKYDRSPPMVERIVRAAYVEAKENDLSPLLILAIIEKESSMDPQVVNDYGAVGLMQVVPRWHSDKLAKVNHPAGLLHPETNIHVGAAILAEYLDEKDGNVRKALVKYSGNARNYFKRVVAFRSDLEKVRLKRA